MQNCIGPKFLKHIIFPQGRITDYKHSLKEMVVFFHCSDRNFNNVFIDSIIKDAVK